MESVTAFIEVSGGSNIKHEHDHSTGRLVVDRILHTPMSYPFNYGYFPNTIAGDNDPLDVMVVTSYQLIPGCYIKCKLLGVLYTEDEKGKDEKIIAVPIDKVDPYMKGINKLTDLKDDQLTRIKYFFEHYKDLEKEKWVKVTGWGDHEAAIEVYQKSKCCKNIGQKCDEFSTTLE